MGTRCGDLDPGVMQFIMNKYGMNIDEMLNVLNKKSGVLGVSGVTSDFRDLEAAADEGNERARLALDMFDYWVAKVVGSYAAAMNGVDAIIFTAGVGEKRHHPRGHLQVPRLPRLRDRPGAEQEARRGHLHLHRRQQGEALRHPDQRGSSSSPATPATSSTAEADST